MKKIFLLTGPKNSGKSTRLLQWVKDKDNIVGIICPKQKGNRELYSIYSNSFIEHEVEYFNDNVIKIGNYNFTKQSFKWAEEELLIALEIIPDWIVIDEIGPLELAGKGFDKVTKILISKPELSESNLLLVIRENLVEQMLLHYSIDKEKIKNVDFI